MSAEREAGRTDMLPADTALEAGDSARLRVPAPGVHGPGDMRVKGAATWEQEMNLLCNMTGLLRPQRAKTVQIEYRKLENEAPFGNMFQGRWQVAE